MEEGILQEVLKKAEITAATKPKGHVGYTRTIKGKTQTVRQKGDVSKEKEPDKLKKEPKDAPKSEEHEKFKNLLEGYFHTQEEMKAMTNLLDLHKVELEGIMGQIKPMLNKFDNIKKEENKFRTEFKEGDWNYKFLAFSKESKPYKDLYTKAFDMLGDLQKEEMKKAEKALKQIGELSRKKVEKALKFSSLIKSYVGKQLTEDVIDRFRADVLNIFAVSSVEDFIKAAKEKEDEKKDKKSVKSGSRVKDRNNEAKGKDSKTKNGKNGKDAKKQLIESLTNLTALREG